MVRSFFRAVWTFLQNAWPPKKEAKPPLIEQLWLEWCEKFSDWPTAFLTLALTDVDMPTKKKILAHAIRGLFGVPKSRDGGFGTEAYQLVTLAKYREKITKVIRTCTPEVATLFAGVLAECMNESCPPTGAGQGKKVKSETYCGSFLFLKFHFAMELLGRLDQNCREGSELFRSLPILRGRMHESLPVGTFLGSSAQFCWKAEVDDRAYSMIGKKPKDPDEWAEWATAMVEYFRAVFYKPTDEEISEGVFDFATVFGVEFFRKRALSILSQHPMELIFYLGDSFLPKETIVHLVVEEKLKEALVDFMELFLLHGCACKECASCYLELCGSDAIFFKKAQDMLTALEKEEQLLLQQKADYEVGVRARRQELIDQFKTLA